jgi:steroid delta-isomerase-like uncharacterized protein
MSTEQNKEVARRYYESVLNDGDVSALDEMAVPGYQEHDPLPRQGTGLQGLKDRVTMMKSGLDPRFTIEDLIAEEDKVVVRWTNSGTNVGEFLGMPPTGKDFTIAGIDIHRIREGRIVEEWTTWDALGLMRQLGAVPEMGSTV